MSVRKREEATTSKNSSFMWPLIKIGIHREGWSFGGRRVGHLMSWLEQVLHSIQAVEIRSLLIREQKEIGSRT